MGEKWDFQEPKMGYRSWIQDLRETGFPRTNEGIQIMDVGSMSNETSKNQEWDIDHI